MNMKVKRSTLEEVKERIQWNRTRLETDKKDYNIQERMIELKEEEEKLKDYRKQCKLNRKEKKRREQQQKDQGDDNQEMMKMMGFSSFQ